ncbi:MAG: HTH-type transcriptional activator CmpR [Chloroflexi bacterium ADurb.Bin325]|nr:MAG: HTH-type transcriptional activator CmpR [Chloroflexi bacterium ADurb.Bin325]
MKLHLLRIFTVVAQHMSFSRAAEALYISQPAVSQAVRELEHQLGLTLFERGAGRLNLTEAGALLAERGRAILAIERTAEEDLRVLKGLQRGVLRVGSSTTIATYLLPPIIATYLRDHPNIDLHLTIQNTYTILNLLLDYQVDMALVEGPVADERIRCEPWQPDELVIIAAPDHPLVLQAAGQCVPADRLADEPFLVREPGSGTREVGDTALAAKGIRLKHTVELGSTEAVKEAVAAGLGLAIVSKATIADQLALNKLTILPCMDLEIRRTFTRVRLIGRTPSPAARAFDQVLDQTRTA